MDPRQVRIMPPLVRKQVVVKSPTTIKVVVQPASNRAVDINQARRHAEPVNKPAPPPAPPEQIKRNVVSPKPHNLTKKTASKKSGVRYISADVSYDSIESIKALRRKGTGRILIIVGNGPSINEIDTALFRDNGLIDTMSINKPDQRLWPTTYWTFFDMSQMRRHEDLWNGYNGTIFNSTAIKKQKQSSMQVKNLGGKGFSRDLIKGLHIGRSSVFASMQIALWMDYRHVYIIGCDMNANGIAGKLHFYGDNPDVDPNVRKDRFAKEAEYYDYAADVLNEDERSRFTFVSAVNPWPFVNRFNKMSHIGCEAQILSHANRLQGIG